MVLKIIAYQKDFFSSGWNIFDVGVTLVSVLETFVFSNLSNMQQLRVFRLARIFRTVRIFRRFPTLYVMLSALGGSAYFIVATFALLTIFAFVFAIIGAQFFAGVKYGSSLSADSNMNDVANSFLLLIQIALQNKMAGIIADGSVEYPSCTKCKACYVSVQVQQGATVATEPKDFNDCGNRTGVLVFFDLYVLGVTIIMHLFMTVLVDSYFAFMKEQQFVLHDKHLESFRFRWREIDPEGKGQVSVLKLRRLLMMLHIDNNPLGSCGLTDAIHHRALRMLILNSSFAELGQNAQCSTAKESSTLQQMITFTQTVRELALLVAGCSALPFEEMHKRRETLNFHAQASIVAETLQRYCYHKFRRDVHLNLFLAQRKQDQDPADITVEDCNASESESCIFNLANCEGVVLLDVKFHRLSLCNSEGKAEGEVDIHSIISVCRNADSMYNSQSTVLSQKQAKGRIRRSNQGSMYVSSNSIEGREYGDSNSARVLCKDGQEIEICLQDAMQCYHFVAILQWYIDRKNSDVEKKNEEECRAGTSEKVHVGADGSLEATALWKRYLIDFALSETQVLILYMCSLKVNVGVAAGVAALLQHPLKCFTSC
jgi:hypothetical protein